MITSSTSLVLAISSAALMHAAPKSGAGTDESTPPKEPMGGRDPGHDQAFV